MFVFYFLVQIFAEPLVAFLFIAFLKLHLIADRQRSEMYACIV